MGQTSSQRRAGLSFFDLPFEIRQMIYDHALDLHPIRVQRARTRAYLSKDMEPYVQERRWLSVTQLSKLLQVVPTEELTSMQMLRNTDRSLLCFDTAIEQPPYSPNAYLRLWSAVFDTRCNASYADPFARSWDTDVAKCIEAFWRASKGQNHCSQTLRLLLPDRTIWILGLDWCISPPASLLNPQAVTLHKHFPGTGYEKYIKRPMSYIFGWRYAGAGSN